MIMEWICVNEQIPPPEYSQYLVCYETWKGLRVGHSLWEEKSHKYKGNKWGWRSKEKIRRKNIRYWMPFPNPPKE
jgi:hypothetical protein